MPTVGEDMIKAAEEALAFVRGEVEFPSEQVHIPKEIDVKRIRKKMGLSQEKFARLINAGVGTVRDWEQGRRVPSGPVQAFLKVLDRNPQAVLEALAA